MDWQGQNSRCVWTRAASLLSLFLTVSSPEQIDSETNKIIAARPDRTEFLAIGHASNSHSKGLWDGWLAFWRGLAARWRNEKILFIFITNSFYFNYKLEVFFVVFMFQKCNQLYQLVYFMLFICWIYWIYLLNNQETSWYIYCYRDKRDIGTEYFGHRPALGYNIKLNTTSVCAVVQPRITTHSEWSSCVIR